MASDVETPSEGVGDELALSTETVAAVEARPHAADLIAAARLIQGEFPHLAYHFAVLALEEIGRGVLLIVGDSLSDASDSPRSIDAVMEDHVQKLFWALWSPTSADRVSATQIDEFRELARQIHDVRKSGLYFDPTVATLPRDTVSPDEAATAIGLAEARLGMETHRRWVPADSQQAEDVRWFTSATADAHLRQLIFSGVALTKLSELADVPSWIRWLREQDEESQRQADELLARERERTEPDEAEAFEEKWKMTFRLYSESHSIRQRPLNSWNEGSRWMQLRQASSNELIVDLTLPKRVLAGAVWPAALTLANRLLLALNIGTMGFFWWRERQDTSRFYEKLRDLEADNEVGIDRTPPLEIDWPKHQVLDERAVGRALLVFAMLPGEGDHPANPAYAHYLRGLALLAKTDVHLQFDLNVFQEFHQALREGTQAYGGWDGEEPFAQAFECFASRFFTDEGDRATYVGAVELAEAGRLDEITLTFDQAAMMKALADAYFLRTLDALAKKRAEDEKAEQEGEATTDGD